MKSHTSSFKMLTLTVLCVFIAVSAYCQYEAGELRLGDPGQLPRGGDCKALSARTNKKKILTATILLYGHMRQDEAGHLPVSAAGQRLLQT